MWKALRSLSNSDSAAAEEFQALLKQVQESMPPEQIQAISEMQLTSASMGELSQELGLSLFGGGRFGDMTPEQLATAQALRESGQAPQGGFGGGFGQGGGVPPEGFVPGSGLGGGGAGRDGQISPELQATMEARRAAGGGSRLGIPASILDAIIQALEAKAQ